MVDDILVCGRIRWFLVVTIWHALVCRLKVGCDIPGKYRVCLDSDAAEFGGYSRVRLNSVVSSCLFSLESFGSNSSWDCVQDLVITKFRYVSIPCRWTMMSTTSRVLRVSQESLRLITTTDHTPSWLWLHLEVARSAINLFLLLRRTSHVLSAVCIPSSLNPELIDSKEFKQWLEECFVR